MGSLGATENGAVLAQRMDAEDPLKHLRQEFIIPTKGDLKSKTLNPAFKTEDIASQQPCTYLCGNSLGLQPKRTKDMVTAFLSTWAKKGVLGHFEQLEDSPLAPFLPMDEQAARKLAPIVGAGPEEVAVMETLTANLHLLMASFYRPTKEKFKVILEGKAFPSDHYAVESQILHHGLDPNEAMILIEPETSQEYTLSTEHILATIDEHADSTAMILLPGVQYYSGQLLDIETITKHAHAKQIIIGWDLAHAVGNVPLQLHRWDVDFAVWCHYKYLNSGPGSIAGMFVHETHGKVNKSKSGERFEFRNRLCGWWGGDKGTRFEMANKFVPIPGAQGYQVGNASAIALSALIASLEIFAMTDMASLRKKSLALTAYLEDLLLTGLTQYPKDQPPYRIITPLRPKERGAQLSVQLQPGMLSHVMEVFEEHGVVLDERKPDVIRVAPAPLYNTFQDVWDFCQIFEGACSTASSKASRH